MAQITGTVAPSSAPASSATTTSPGGGNSAPTTSAVGTNVPPATGTATEGNPSPTTTKSISASAGAGDSGSGSSSSAQNGLSGGAIGGIVGGVVGGILIIALVVYLAFACGRRRGARENYTSNNYGAPAIVEENIMVPQTPMSQSAYPQKHNGYGADVIPVPTGYNASAPHAPVMVSEVGDHKTPTSNRAELGPSP